MARHTYPADPDGRTDADARSGAGVMNAKQAEVRPDEEHADRAADRAGYRDLDTQLEQTAGMTRAQVDRQRATPRPKPAPVRDARMVRKLAPISHLRQPVSGRQRSARSVTKHAVQDELSGTQYRAMRQLLVDERGRWDQVNDALSEAVGDVQQLPEQEISKVQRIDRAIQAYEAASSRGHVVYSNVVMPNHVTARELTDYVRGNFTKGDEVVFDRFTLGAHTMHEIEHPDPYQHKVVVMEIATRRGMYLGQSGHGQDTSHLLPRGMQLWVHGVGQARYQRPDGSVGRRTVIQLSDVPPPPKKRPTPRPPRTAGQ